jgi:hypothetical protein
MSNGHANSVLERLVVRENPEQFSLNSIRRYSIDVNEHFLLETPGELLTITTPHFYESPCVKAIPFLRKTNKVFNCQTVKRYVKQV